MGVVILSSELSSCLLRRNPVVLTMREFFMSNDGNVSFTPIPFPFSPFQKKPLSFTTIVLLFIYLLVFLHSLCRREFLFFTICFFLFSFSYLTSFYFHIFSWWIVGAFTFSLFCLFFVLFFRGASEVAGIRFFFCTL